MEKKYIHIIIAIVVLMTALGLGTWYIIEHKNAQSEKEFLQQGITLSSEGANWTPEQNKSLQQGLVNSIGKYLEAISYTNAVFQADIENTVYVEWKERVDKAIQLWEELEQIENDMIALLEELGVPELSQSVSRESITFSNAKKYSCISMVNAAGGSEIPELGAVTAVFDSANHGGKIRKIMDVFGWDKETAFYHLKREQGLMESEAWDQAGDTYARWETAMRAIKDTSKVTVFVGANIISAGGASTAVGAFQAITVAVGGVSLAIEVGEDINIAIGNEENAAVLRQAQEVIKPIVEIVCINSLKDIGDPGNLFYITDKAGQLYDLAKEGYVHLFKDETGKIIASKEPLEGSEVSEPDLEKSKTAGLPEGKYKIDGENIDVKKEAEKPKIKEGEKEIQNIDAIDEIAEILANLETPQGPTVQSDSTKIRTSQVSTLTINIPEGFTGPFEVEYISVGGSGAGVVLPSTINSRNFTGEFISSKPGTFVVEIKIIDAAGQVYIAKTTIFVEGEELIEEENLIDTQEGKGMSFECIIPSKYPSTKEGCHVNVVCPNSENPCSEADSKFIGKIKAITAGYRDLDPYQCSEIFSIEACKTVNPEMCLKAWEGKDSEDGFSEAEKEACAQVDRNLCEIEKKKLGGLYEHCVEFLSYPDGAFSKIQPAREELLDCYNQVRAKKNKACIDNFSAIREQEKSQILEEVEVLRNEQKKIMAEERNAWDQISQLEDQIYELNPRQDTDEIAALESQIAELREEGVRLDNKYKASEAEISVLYEKRDKLMSNGCYNYCAESIDDPQFKALGKFAGKINQLSDYKFLIEITE